MRLAWLPMTVLAASLAGPAQAAPPTAPATVTVTGRAGQVTTLRLTTTARLGNGGYDTPVSSAAPWAGVALARLDDTDGNAYIHYTMRDAVLCPGRRCEPPKGFQPTVALTDDGKGSAVLAPGEYGVALLGPAGATVTATLRLRGPRPGRLSLRTAHRATSYVARTFEPVANGTVNRGFGRVMSGGRVMLDSLAVAFVLDSSAVAEYSMCWTSGGRRDLDSNVGGVGPCADVSGMDFLWGPNPMPVLVDVGDRAVGIAFGGGAGVSPAGDSGLGFDAQAAGVARVSAVYVAVVF